MTDWRTIFLIYCGISLITSIVALIYLYPFHPTTLIGGFVWFALSLPVAIGLELLGSLFLNQHVSNSINPDRNKLSALRILYALIAIVLLVTIMGFIIGFSESQFSEFIQKNYSAGN